MNSEEIRKALRTLKKGDMVAIKIKDKPEIDGIYEFLGRQIDKVEKKIVLRFDSHKTTVREYCIYNLEGHSLSPIDRSVRSGNDIGEIRVIPKCSILKILNTLKIKKERK